MPPKRAPGTRGTRSGTRSQSTTQVPLVEAFDVVTVPDSPVAHSSTNSRRERAAADHLRPNQERVRRNITPRRSRGKAMPQEEIPEVYRDMLMEVVGPSRKRPEELSGSERRGPSKRRKVVVGITSEAGPSGDGDKGKGVLKYTDDQEQNLENLDNQESEVLSAEEGEEEDGDGDGEGEEEDGDGDGEDWEDVDLNPEALSKPQVLELTLGPEDKQKIGPVRRTITAVDRRIRLEVHKMHLLCLLLHVYQKSQWCNTSTMKENLRPLITKEVHLLLNPDPDDQQFRRSYNFLAGLNKVLEMWQKKFRVTRKGTLKAHWYDKGTLEVIFSQPPKDGDPPMKKNDFLAASVNLTGSRDLGAQLFCALLRSAGVTCRLVCSLQPLSFTFQDRSTPAKLAPTIPIAALQEDDTSGDDNGARVNNRFDGPGPATPTPPTRGSGGGLRRPRFREPIIKLHTPTKITSTTIIRDSPYPVYWVEAWNMATQKWIAVDPLATSTVGKPSKLEPPMSDVENIMSYVVAFEEEGQATDVTRRYAKNYNGKTRKLRVSCTKDGPEWWGRVLKVFQRGWDLDRDQLEAAELLDREVSEPIPNNIQDLKDHPLFALKRHLKRNQVIHPGKKVGSITTGTGNRKVTETIFRRQDVKVVRSSEQWYRLGRELKPGEQPLKYVAARRRLKGRSGDMDGEPEEDGEEGGRQSAMYAEFQTVLYEPPAIVQGRVPKNSFGNLDIFVPSMVPKGGVHLPYKGIAKAAKLLGVDYAEAVAGFDFKNRQASPIMNGIVVAKEYREAVEAVMEAFLDEQSEADEFKKSIEALKRWRHFLMGLRIRKRLEIYQDDKTERKGDIEKEDKMDEGGKDMGGSFLPGEVEGKGGGGFIAGDDSGGGGGFVVGDDCGESGGGFFVGDDYDESGGGGFFAEEEKSETGDEELFEDPEDEDLGWF